MDFWKTKPIDMILHEGEKEGEELKKELNVRDLVVIGIGAIIGTGIFVLTGVAASQYAGPGIIISFIISGFVAGLTALVYAELSSMVPVAGSAYTYSYAALGELVAWIIGWDLVLEYTVAAGAVSIGWSGYLVDLLKTINIHLPKYLITSPLRGGIINLPAFLIAIIITWFLLQGIRKSATINTVIVVIKLLVIAFFIILGSTKIEPTNWTPFIPKGWSGIMTGAAIIFFAYIGFDSVSTAAEEVKNPKKDLPKGIIYSLIISTVLYILVAIVLTGMVPYYELNTASPVARAMLKVGYKWASGIVSIGAIAGLTSVLLVDMYAQSRVFFAMARDGLLPKFLARLHPRYNTPYLITMITGVAVALISGFLPIGVVAKLANIGTLSAFILVSLGVIILRKKKPDLERPFRTPFVPYLPIITILFCFYLIGSLPPLTWIRFIIWLGIGLLIYFFYGRKHSLLNNNQ